MRVEAPQVYHLGTQAGQWAQAGSPRYTRPGIDALAGSAPLAGTAKARGERAGHAFGIFAFSIQSYPWCAGVSPESIGVAPVAVKAAETKLKPWKERWGPELRSNASSLLQATHCAPS